MQSHPDWSRKFVNDPWWVEIGLSPYENRKRYMERLQEGRRVISEFPYLIRHFTFLTSTSLAPFPFVLFLAPSSVVAITWLFERINPLYNASVVQLARTSSIMRLVMSSSPDWSKNFQIFHITYDDSWWLEVGIDMWFGAQSSVRKDPMY